MRKRVSHIMRPILVTTFVVAVVCTTLSSAADKPSRLSNRATEEDRVLPLFHGVSEETLDILDSLERTTSVNYRDTPLLEAVEQLARQNDIPLKVDEAYLEDAGIDVTRLRVTLSRTSMKVRTILTDMLRETEVGWTVAEGSLAITNCDPCFPKKVIAIYPVADLVSEDPKDLQRLSTTIQSTTSASWDKDDHNGGSISLLQTSHTLVIMQTWTTHYEVIDLLQNLRAAKRIGREVKQKMDGDQPPRQGAARKLNRRKSRSSHTSERTNGPGFFSLRPMQQQ